MQHNAHVRALEHAFRQADRLTAEDIRSILHGMTEGVIVEGPERELIGLNEAAARLNGFNSFEDARAAFEQLKRGPADFVLLDGGGKPLPFSEWPISRAGRREPFSGVEITIVNGGGRHLWTGRFSGWPVLDAFGCDTGLFVTTFYDITEERRTERLLRESEARFRALADSTPVMIWATDTEGRIRFVNRAYTQFFGVGERELRDGDWQPLVHPEDAANYVESFFAALREHAPFRAQARVRRHDGEWRWIESYGAPELGPSGELIGFVGSSPDITERKHAEEALREAERRKDETLAMIAHELRNPLAPISNAVRVLSQAPSDSTHAQQARQIIERQVQNMSRLIGDLLDISRIANGRVELRFERVDLNQLVAHTAEDFRPELEKRGVTLDLETFQTRLCIDGDAQRLNQLVGNLLHNAAKFTPAGGRVQVQVGLESDQSQALAVLRVKDSGIGIERAVLPHVFEPFSQGNRAVAGDRAGLGLGLAVVKGFAELHGGAVRVRSEGRGRGAEFTVYLPAPSTAAKAEHMG